MIQEQWIIENKTAYKIQVSYIGEIDEEPVKTYQGSKSETVQEKVTAQQAKIEKLSSALKSLQSAEIKAEWKAKVTAI